MYPLAEVLRLVEAGENVNEVEAAGNTPLHNAAFEGWLEGVELLIQLGAKVNASNNAGDTPWHWATNMGHNEVLAVLEQVWNSHIRVAVMLKPDCVIIKAAKVPDVCLLA